MARTTRYGICDVWLADDGPVIVAHGSHVLFQQPGAAPQTLPISGQTIVPCRSAQQVLVADNGVDGNSVGLTLLDWSDDLSNTYFDLSDHVSGGLVLATSFDGHTAYVADTDSIHRLEFNNGKMTVAGHCSALFSVALHPLGEDRLWVKGSTVGAANYAVYDLPTLTLVDQAPVDTGLELRRADKLMMKQAHVGDVVDITALDSKTLPLEWSTMSQIPPMSSSPVHLIETSVDADNRILDAPQHYLTSPNTNWRYPLHHSIDVPPRMHALGRFVAIATGSADHGQWAVVDIETGEELAVRSRPISDVACVRICGNHLAVAWTDGSVEVVGLPSA